jgi:ring-1,2-phenylacetyl-CoA epoxidase subunit PaaD
MVSSTEVFDVLRTIDDPEMPISIVDLGMVADVRVEPTVEDGGRAAVAVDLLPTFVGCFALPYIEAEVRRKISALPDVAAVDVTSRFHPPWTVDRITEAGRAALRKHGVTVPAGELRCPFCDSTKVRVDSPFGPTRCRMIYYCEHCRSSFEHLKRVEQGGPILEIGSLPRSEDGR